MPRQVRLVGSDDAWDVLCETETTMVLVNPAAKLRNQVSELEAKLDEVRALLDGVQKTALRQASPAAR